MAAPHFVNVDLEIESKHDLAVLEAELGKNVCVLFGDQISPGCLWLFRALDSLPAPVPGGGR
jgi:hypothetical protein